MFGTVLRIERASIHDGPGLRTVVFLKGCPLQCVWCSTPESQSAQVETGYGSVMTTAEVIQEVLKDEVFYFHSGGGLTISGGEPLAQSEFTADLLLGAKENGIHTAIETTLFANAYAIARVLPLVDHLFVDLKHTDEKWHTSLVGATNQTILANLRNIGESDYSGVITVRVPLVPTLNDDDENLLKTARVCQEIKQVQQLELLPYHRLGVNTYQKLGRSYQLDYLAPPSKEYVAERVAFLHKNAPNLLVQIAQ